MKKYLFLSLVAASLAFSPVVSQAKTSQPEAQAVVDSNIVDITTKVVDVNYDTRVLTVEGPEGNVDIKVSAQVKNLKEIKKGDLVKLKYNESIALMLKKKTKKEGTSSTVTDTTTIQNTNKKPEYSERQVINLVATITNIDEKKSSVTLKGPQGKSVKVAVADKKNLEGVKVGDQVDISYSESLAVDVQKAPKK